MATKSVIEPEVIPGFKVMDWLRGVREQHNKLRKENPEQYAAMMEEIRRGMKKNASLEELVFGSSHVEC